MRKMLDEILARAMTRRRRAELQRALEASPAIADASSFDEFGAPEGGFGRLDPLLADAAAAEARSHG